MSIENALAGVAVRHLESAAAWYEQLIGRAGEQPMREVFEWLLPSGGVLQVFEDAGRGGSSSVMFSVTGIDNHLENLSARGIEIGKVTRSEVVTTAILEDPDGNQVVLAEQHTHSLAR